MIGETLDGRYEILRKIGGGGMGVVYEGRHKGTGRRVAVKLITGDFAKDPLVVARFHREAKASGAIETQHIAQVLDTGVDPASSLPYIVMEHLNGEDLASALARVGALPPEIALRVAAQVCIGLQKAHEAKVVHRDIKPGNLFLAEREDGELIVKVLDFGIAKIKVERAQQLEASGLTRTGNVLGSPLYMSPEQARGYKDIDQRSDLWSLGVVLYQMLCGRRPHEDIEALGELIIAICSEAPRPVQDFAPWVPPQIAAIVHGALQFDPASRYQSAAEMLEAIRPLLPGGWSLHARMLAPVGEETRKVVAPRFEVVAQSGPQAVYRPSDPSIAGAALDPTIAEVPLSSVLPSSPSYPISAAWTPGAPPAQPTALAATGGPVSNELPAAAAAPPPRSAGALALRAGVALVASAAAAFGLLHALGPKPAAPPAPPTVEVPVPPPRAAAPATAAPPAIPTVRVSIVPPDASVEVDGAPAALKDGFVEIAGQLGSVHEVRLVRGALDQTKRVVVTVAGPMPPKIELEAAAPAPGGALRPAPAVATSARPAPPPGVTPSAKPSTPPVPPTPPTATPAKPGPSATAPKTPPRPT